MMICFSVSIQKYENFKPALTGFETLSGLIIKKGAPFLMHLFLK